LRSTFPERRQQAEKNGLVGPFFFGAARWQGWKSREKSQIAWDVGAVGNIAVEKPLFALIERSVEDLGYELADLERSGGLLRVSIDAAQGITIEDCERVTRQLSHVLTVENVAYDRLEVGSAGVDRRLWRRRDFERFAGARIDVRLRALLDGRRKLRGRLLELVAGDGAERIRLKVEVEPAAKAAPGKAAPKRPAKKAAEVEGPTVEVALAQIEWARLVPELNFKGIGRGAAK
jgi:ribosome maturation factor RimP